jgi:hypothetical protein
MDRLLSRLTRSIDFCAAARAFSTPPTAPSPAPPTPTPHSSTWLEIQRHVAEFHHNFSRFEKNLAETTTLVNALKQRFRTIAATMNGPTANRSAP